MQREDIFERAKHFYYSHFAPERQKVLQDLATIRDDIQEEERRHAIGNIAYQSVKTVSIGLIIAGVIAVPFTLGGSLVLTGASAAARVSSVAASAIHRKVKLEKINKMISNAEQSMRNHEKTCFEMYEWFRMLKEYLQSERGQGDEFLRSVPAYSLDDATLASMIATYIGIVVGVGAVLLSVLNLLEINAGKMSDESEKIQKVIHELETQDSAFRNFFEKV